MLLISREWIPPIAQAYGREAGMPDNLALHETGLVAMHASIKLLDLAPWHMKLWLGSLEAIASLWCAAYRFYNKKKANPKKELEIYETFPLIASPMLQVYRRLAAMAWFEHPLVLAHYGIAEKAEARQNRFRQMYKQVA